jgi:hypothetical protein
MQRLWNGAWVKSASIWRRKLQISAYGRQWSVNGDDGGFKAMEFSPLGFSMRFLRAQDKPDRHRGTRFLLSVGM